MESMMESFCKNFQFIIDIWQCCNAFELVDLSRYWCLFKFDQDIWVFQCFRKLMAKLKGSFENGEGRQPTIGCPASYMLMIRQLRVLKKTILWKAKEVALIFSVKKFCNICRKIPVLESLLNKVACLQCVTLSKKETLIQMFSCEV